MSATLAPETRLAALRARSYRTLAALFHHPNAETWETLAGRDALAADLEELGVEASALPLIGWLNHHQLADLRAAWVATFDPSGGLKVAPNETFYTKTSQAHGLTRNVEAADIAGFYEAFRVHPRPGAGRPGHIALELDFMQLLSVKEALARTHGTPEQLEITLAAARAFLTDHLGTWVGVLARNLAAHGARPYADAGALIEELVRSDAERLGAQPRVLTDIPPLPPMKRERRRRP